MSESYSGPYVPLGPGTFGHRVLKTVFVPVADLALDTTFTSGDLMQNFMGFSRQVYKAILFSPTDPTATMDVRIEEFFPRPGEKNDGDTAHGFWVTKGGLGTVTGVTAHDGTFGTGEMFEHNSEDTLRLARLVVTPRTAVPAGVGAGIWVEFGGRIDA